MLDELVKFIRSNNYENYKKECLEIFEKVDDHFQNEKSFYLYSIFWIIAFEVGRISLAKKLSQKFYKHILENKRIPAIKKFIADVERLKFTKSLKYKNDLNVLMGKKLADKDQSIILSLHPETFKDSKEDLKNYLIFETNWSETHWKLAYEFVLRYYYDEQVFLSLFEKTIESKKEKHYIVFEEKLKAKKLNLKSYRYKKETKEKKIDNDFKTEYTLNNLAYSLFAGNAQLDNVDQDIIINSFKDYDWHKDLAKAEDMAVAFSFLGMDQVVIYLCENYLGLIEDVKEKISLNYLMAEALFNCGNWHRCIDLAEDVISEYPLLESENTAFEYVRAESYFHLKKYSMAKNIFAKIKKNNPNYRLVTERLKAIEKIK